MPPSPNITTGLNTGSRTTPRMVSAGFGHARNDHPVDARQRRAIGGTLHQGAVGIAHL